MLFDIDLNIEESMSQLFTVEGERVVSVSVDSFILAFIGSLDAVRTSSHSFVTSLYISGRLLRTKSLIQE